MKKREGERQRDNEVRDDFTSVPAHLKFENPNNKRAYTINNKYVFRHVCLVEKKVFQTLHTTFY